jgi:hypothetical protein
MAVLNLGEQALTGLFPKTREAKVTTGRCSCCGVPTRGFLQLAQAAAYRYLVFVARPQISVRMAFHVNGNPYPGEFLSAKRTSAARFVIYHAKPQWR